MSTTKIGWIGLGKMGIPMSQQLIKAGYSVTVYNRSAGKEDELKKMGAATAASPGALIQQTDVIIVMVTDDKAIDQIFNGENGLTGAGTSGKIIINMSTVSPAISRQMAVLLKQQGNHYLDAPVSGSIKQATDGTLVIMAGGGAEEFETVKPILEKMGKLAMLIGDTGAGNTAKLAINTLLAIHAQGLAEAIVFAKTNGIKTEDLVTLISNSAIGNVFSKIKGDAIINGNYTPAFTLNNIVKDLQLAKNLGLSSPLGNAAYDTFKQAQPAFGDEDLIAVIKQL